MYIQELFDFIKRSPTAFHAVDSLKNMLTAAGFNYLREGEAWSIVPGGKYCVTRNGTSIIAFKVGADMDTLRFNIAASHSDSPAFKLKENAEITLRGKYSKLNTQGYGSMLCASWLDRPLSLAGRVIIKEECGFSTRLVNLDRDLLLIPNLAIHMNRQANHGMEYNNQIDMLPLLGGKVCEPGTVKKLIADELGISPDDIYGSELFVYNRTTPSRWGLDNEFISAPKLDDLECAYASLKAFIDNGSDRTVQVFACFDNEEVGSGTKQGAASPFMYDTLARINRALGGNEDSLCRALASSFMLSCDNAQAVHPNHPEKADETNCVYMNDGIVIKSHAGQKYTTDAVSAAVFKAICEKAAVPVQHFANRSDITGGSTLGNIAMTQVAVNCVDIGLPQLAMHSSYETAGVKDVEYMIRAVSEFYKTFLTADGDMLKIE